MNKQIIPAKNAARQATQAAQAAVQAALALRRNGYHEQADAIWRASIGVIAAPTAWRSI